MTFLRDARLGLRLLWRHPSFTAIALVTLALGVAANTAIFTVVYATLLAPLPYEDADRLVVVHSRVKGLRNATAGGDYVEWTRRQRSFEALHAWSDRRVSLAATGESPDQVPARLVTPGFLTTHGFRMIAGRDFVSDEGVVGRDRVTVLTHRLWQTRFGGASIVGRQVRVDGKLHTVVGVLAPSIADRMEYALYVPLALRPDQLNHDFHWLMVLGKLKPDVTLAQSNAEMVAIAKQLESLLPKSNTGWSASVEPLKHSFLGRNLIATLWLLLGAVGFVLLIACANVANLLLARGAARQRELAVRSALGASGRRLFAQLLTENVVLAAAGGLLGLTLAAFLMDGILALVPPETLPSEADLRLNMPVLIFTLGVSLISGVLFGSAPAWQVTRLNVNDVLKDAGRASIGSGRPWMRRAFVISEFALALTLLAGAGLAITSLVRLATVDLGLKTEGLLTFSLSVPIDRLKTGDRVERFYRQLTEQAREIPGVTSASVSNWMPVVGVTYGRPFFVEGRPVSASSQRASARFNMVTPDYFKTFGIPIQRGRAFTEQDSAAAARVAIVNEAFVRQHLQGVDPLKQRVILDDLIPGVEGLGPSVAWQIVGVYPTVRNAGPRNDFPEIDVPFAQSPWPDATMALRVATRDPHAVRSSVAAIVRSLDPDLPIADVKTLDQRLYETMAFDRFQAVLFGAFAMVALVLAALGIYGVMSFVVAQRTHEIGLRMALGASRQQVLHDILREGLTTAWVGIALGSIGAYLVGRAMHGILFGVGAIDPAAFSIVAALLLSASILACLIPALRAASVDPMTALRDG